MADDRSPDLSAMLGQLMSDPQALAGLMNMAGALFSAQSGSAAPTEPAPEPSDSLPAMASQPNAAANSPDSAEAALLCALKPYLRPSRAAKIDSMLGMLQAMKLFGMFMGNNGKR